MSKPKFTPGPWYAEKGEDDDSGTFFVSHSGTVCTSTTVCNLEHNPTEDEANANLIAAAPDLYEALIRCISELERASSMGINIVPGVIEAACDTLRKARGESCQA